MSKAMILESEDIINEREVQIEETCTKHLKASVVNWKRNKPEFFLYFSQMIN